MAARMSPRFRTLSDVDWETFEDGEVPTYDSGTDTLTGEAAGAAGDVAAHSADTTNVHGIADTAVLASDAELAAHNADTTFVHGVADTSVLATDAELAAHEADTSVHGVADTAVLATDAEVAVAVSDHSADTTSVHGIADTSVLATDAEVASAVSDHSADTTSVHGIADTAALATDSEVATAVSDHATDTTSVHGITDTTVLATDAEVTAAVSAHESDTTVHGVDTANVPSSGQKAALAGTSGTPAADNRYVTEDDPALGGADLSDAVILEPGVAGRNTIQPTADISGLVVKRPVGAGEYTSSIELHDENGNFLGELSPKVLSLYGPGPHIFNLQDPANGLEGAWVYFDPAHGFDVRRDGDTDTAIRVQPIDDTANARFRIFCNGTLNWAGSSGTADTAVSRVEANVLAAPSLEFSEATAPATPGANKGRVYFEDSGGVTRACVKFPSGNVVVIAEDF